MIQNADYTILPGFSKLFKDFFVKDSAVFQRFPANHDPGKTFQKRLDSFKNRANMMPVFKKSMEKLELSSEQQANLELLKNENSLVVISGQQLGFFGGALYTFFKAQSAIAHARKFATENPGMDFIPVFWVEDNDHDRAEAEQTAILNKECQILTLKAPGDLEHQTGVSIGEIRITDDITPLLENLASELEPSPYSGDTLQLLKEIYTPGKLWSDAYTELLHYFFKNTGLLFVKGSEVRKSGLSREILLKELHNPGHAKARVERAGSELLKAGYHVQAEPSDVHLFLHEGKQRFKINISENAFSVNGREIVAEELLKTAENEPGRFSPNVLLRPIVQDVVFPTAAYIAGPGELAYAAELCEMYEFYGVEMPMFVPRHSATLVSAKTEKFLVKENLEFTDFLKTWQEIEREFTVKISDAEINALFKKNESDVAKFFKSISDRAVSIDKSLAGAVAATQTVTAKQFTRFLKKVNAAQKRRESALFKRYRDTWSALYPNATLQERYFSIVHFWAEAGEEDLREALEAFFEGEADKHFLIRL